MLTPDGDAEVITEQVTPVILKVIQNPQMCLNHLDKGRTRVIRTEAEESIVILPIHIAQMRRAC